jgi:hypothetical protein
MPHEACGLFFSKVQPEEEQQPWTVESSPFVWQEPPFYLPPSP